MINTYWLSGRAGRKNIWLSFMAHEASLRSVHTPWHWDKYFPVQPSHSVNKYISFQYGNYTTYLGELGLSFCPELGAKWVKTITFLYSGNVTPSWGRLRWVKMRINVPSSVPQLATPAWEINSHRILYKMKVGPLEDIEDNNKNYNKWSLMYSSLLWKKRL